MSDEAWENLRLVSTKLAENYYAVRVESAIEQELARQSEEAKLHQAALDKLKEFRGLLQHLHYEYLIRVPDQQPFYSADLNRLISQYETYVKEKWK